MSAVKNVFLKKKIEGVVYDLYPHTDAGVVSYESGSVADKLASLTTGLSNVITSDTVDAKIKAESTALYNKIMGLTGAEGDTINEAYDTLKEVATYLEAHGSVVAGFTSDINGLKEAIGDNNSGILSRIISLENKVGNESSGIIKDVADIKTTIGNDTSGLTKQINTNTANISGLQTEIGTDNNSGLKGRIGTLETTVGDNFSGLVRDVNGVKLTIGDENSGLTQRIGNLETTVGGRDSGLVKDVADLKTQVATKGSIVACYGGVNEDTADPDTLYIVY